MIYRPRVPREARHRRFSSSPVSLTYTGRNGGFKMSLSKEFNANSKRNVSEEVDTETFGGKTLSRYTCTVSFNKVRKVEVQVEQTPAVIVRRAFGMRM